jgi:membrane protein DedA with SNARE-associated domain
MRNPRDTPASKWLSPDVFDLHPFIPLLAAMSLAAATLVSEDLTCIAAGVLVAEGQLTFAVAAGGCLAGIVAGDMLLMLAGRLLGNRALELPWIQRIVGAETIARVSRWFARRGGIVVAFSRFVPGTRLAAYLAAGAFGVKTWQFALYVTATALVWVPVLVWLSAVAGAEVVRAGVGSAGGIVLRAAVAIAAVALGVRLLRSAARAASRRTRRRLYGMWQRVTRWEFWPTWAFYLPIVAYVLLLMVRYRSLTLFTAANPDIPAGGFVGESKFDILRGLARDDGRVARAALLPAGPAPEIRAAMARGFMERTGLAFPVVLKPDQGQRGSGVVIVRSDQELSVRLAEAPIDMIVQEYVRGLELGVFYYRRPSEARGHIFSITEKRFPAVVGDGRRTLEELILDDERAVCLERVHRRVHRTALGSVPANGTVVPLVEIGSHCRGSLFVDAGHLATPALVDAFDRIAQQFGGFYFGRFDVRAPSAEEFSRHAAFRIIELNGVTSEATHIYDPGSSVWSAYRVLRAQWRLAFEIGAENRRLGIAPASLASLVGLVIRYRHLARMHPEQVAS